MHFLSHHRGKGRDSHRSARAGGWPRLWLRHLSGRLPVERAILAEAERGFVQAARIARIEGRTRAGDRYSETRGCLLPLILPPISDEARQTARTEEKCGCCPRKYRL